MLIVVLYVLCVVFILYIFVKVFLRKCFGRTRRLNSRVLFLCLNRILGLFVILFMIVFYFIIMSLFGDILEIVNGRILEEMFFFDYMMVVVKLKFIYR